MAEQTLTRKPAPKVLIVGLASCFGCQLQITNVESHLLDILGQIDVQYWQLASSAPMADEYEIAIIEGAVTTEEAVHQVESIREKARYVMAIGACATTGGIPGMAAPGLQQHAAAVYGDEIPEASGTLVAPRPVHDFIAVDAEVYACPIQSLDFVRALQDMIYGSNRSKSSVVLCSECKLNGTDCFYTRGRMCLGLVTRGGCGALCVNLGRPCNGCRGLSPDANVDTARAFVEAAGQSVCAFDKALEMFNQVKLTDSETL